MRAPDNVLFRSSMAVFDETMFPKCPLTDRRGTTRVWPPREDMYDQAGQPETTPQEDLDDDDVDHSGHRPFQRRNGRPHDDEGEQHDAPKDQVPPPQPPVEQPAPPVEPRRSGRERKPVTRKGNVYGEQRKPQDIIKDIEKQGRWKKMVSEGQGRPQSKLGPSRQQQQVPGPSAPNPTPSDIPVESAPSNEDAAEQAELLLAQLCQEGGVPLVELLLSKALSTTDNGLPDGSSLREWTFRDILKLPKKELEEWMAACCDELEALRKRKVYELVDRPKGRKSHQKPLGFQRQN